MMGKMMMMVMVMMIHSNIKMRYGGMASPKTKDIMERTRSMLVVMMMMIGYTNMRYIDDLSTYLG